MDRLPVRDRTAVPPQLFRACAIFVASLFLISTAPARAEIFKWKDAEGRLHFSQDLNQVPPQYRRQAEGGMRAEGSGPAIQTYTPAAPSAAAARRRANRNASKRPASNGKVHKIRVQKTGTTMLVNVRLNDRVVAPFYIDTGASDVALPEWVAKELGLKLEGARTAYYGTANGTIKQAIVTLDSVELGGARAENVPASVSKTMRTGLLGLSFFNHFRYRVDPVAGIVTLQSNGLVEAGLIRGGRSEMQWRSQFNALNLRRASVERTLDEINPNWSRRKAELHAALDEVERQRKVLEDEADEARVPMRWRD